MTAADSAPSDAERELAARRAELEREFEANVRDWKMRERRLIERLEEDRKEWEQVRRAQKQELADRLEQARRHDETRRRDAEALKSARREADAAKSLRAEHADAQAGAKAAQQGAAETTQRLVAARALLAWAVMFLVAGGAALLYALAVGAPRAAAVVAVALLAAGLGVEWKRRRTPPAES